MSDLRPWLVNSLAALIVAVVVGIVVYFAQKTPPASISPTPITSSETTTPVPSDSTLSPLEPSLPPGQAGQTLDLQVYFHNRQQDPDFDCTQVFPVTRTVPVTTLVGSAALNQLFSGPTENEKAQGYTSLFSQATKNSLKILRVQNDVAYVDLHDIRESLANATSSCGAAQFLAAISQTMMQFPTVKKIRYAINGSATDFYGWLQMGCSLDNEYCANEIYKQNLIKLTTPAAGQQISSPVIITGEARGNWFFEASFPVEVRNAQEQVIGRGIAQTKANWMTSDFVPFSATIAFDAPGTSAGFLVLKKDNPSGLPQNDDEVRIFVTY